MAGTVLGLAPLQRPGIRHPGHRIGLCATETHCADGLTPAESLLVAGAPAARVAEFATGRWCARRALAQVGGCLDSAVLADARGAPRWPVGFVGSITHTRGWTGAVAARDGLRGITSIGLDAEVAAPLPDGVIEVVASPAERHRLDRLHELDPATPWDTVLFTAKEAAYKAWYPLTRVVLPHDAVEVTLVPDGRFTADLSATSAPRPASDMGGGRRARRLRAPSVRGRCRLGEGVLVSLAVVG